MDSKLLLFSPLKLFLNSKFLGKARLAGQDAIRGGIDSTNNSLCATTKKYLAIPIVRK